MKASRVVGVVLLGLSLGLALGGCSSAGDGGGTGGSAPAGSSERSATSAGSSPSASPSPAPTDAADLLTSAAGALAEVSSFHVTGPLSADGGTGEVDITYGPAGTGLYTAAKSDGGQLELRKTADGTVYLRANAEYLDAIAATAAETGSELPDLSSAADRWIVLDEQSPWALQAFSAQLDRDLFTGLLTIGARNADGELSGPDDLDGTSVYSVTDSGEGNVTTVAADTYLPLSISRGDGSDLTITFDGYGDPVEVTAPPADEIVDLPS